MLTEISYFILIVGLYFIGCFVVSVISARVGVLPTRSASFSSSLDVLRGIAAFLVFGAHSTMYFSIAPEQVITSAMGNVGVLLFFMLTGHLFWGQIRTNKYNASNFFYKRIYRLVPIMLVVITVVVLLDWIEARFPIPNKHQLLAIIRNYGFGFGKVVNSTGNVNDMFSPDVFLRINSIWTLRWEWMFYLCIPILAVLRNFKIICLFTLFLILLFMDPFQLMAGTTDIVFLLAFWFGAFSSELEKYKNSWIRFIFTKSASNIILILGVTLFFYYLLGGELSQKNIRVPIIILFVFPIFLYFVVSKEIITRFSWSPMQLVGKISYSFYLWHLVVNYYIIRIFNISQSMIIFIITCFLMMIVGISLSVFTYKFIEEPFLKKVH